MTEKIFNITTSASITNEFVEAIAEHRGVGELDPDFSLYDEFDVDAIERFVRSESPTDICIQFRLDDAIVRMEQDTEDEFRITVGGSNREVLSK